MTTGNAWQKKNSAFDPRTPSLIKPEDPFCSLMSKDLKLMTQEEKEKFQSEIKDAKNRVSFPNNPTLFPESIRIKLQNLKKES